VSSLIETEATGGPRVVPILVAAFLGFLAGQLAASLFDIVAVQITHFHGGMTQLAQTASPPWWASALGLLGLWTGFGSDIYYAHFYGNLKPLADQWKPRASDIVYVALGVVCQWLIDLIYRPFHFKQLNRPTNHLFGAAHGPTLVLLIVMTLLIAPLMEEWLFRGVIFRSISEGGSPGSRTGVVLGVVVSAVLFGLAHGEPLQFAGLALLGIVLALLVVRTKRLLPSVITHVSFNGIAIIAFVAQRAGH
jgi:membrane protease YdiL (CAAX protease family)